MTSVLPTIIVASGVGLALVAATDLRATNSVATERASPAAELRHFDPVLSGALCLPDGDDRRRLLGFYQKVAAATETRPFSPQAAGSDAGDATDAPLYDNLGTLSYPIATKSPMAQRYFDQGLRLAYGFNHAEARRAFRTAQKHDPDCAMCSWGEALVLGPNINAPMAADAVAPAMAAVARAQQNAASASAHEQALIAALAARYASDPKAERTALDAAYADADRRGRGAVSRGRHHPTAPCRGADGSHALGLLGRRRRQAQGQDRRDRFDASKRCWRGIRITRARSTITSTWWRPRPRRSGRCPMPSGSRLRCREPGISCTCRSTSTIESATTKAALAANKAAVTVDEAYIAQAAPTGIYPGAYYPHNVHSLMVSAQMAGEGATAVAAAEKLARVVTPEAARTIPWVQPIAAAPFFTHAQFSAPRVVLALAAPER